MGSLMMNEAEYDYWLSSLSEAFNLIGQEAKLYQVEENHRDLHNDIEKLTLVPSVDIGIIFEENPRPILKKFNWIVEDEELPYLAYIVSKDSQGKSVVVSEYMVVEVLSKFGVTSDRLFQVTSVRGTSINPLLWICKLAPYRNKVDFNPETPEIEHTEREETGTNYAYLHLEE